MDINIKTKFSIGDTVYFVKESTSYYEIPCTHCGGNYREIVNNIEYKCPYCTGGREKQKIKHYEVESGIVTNIRIALYGEREVVDRITHNHIRTNVLYSVTPHNAVDDYYDTDANSISKYEGELYATRADADATVESVKTVTTIDENGRQIKRAINILTGTSRKTTTIFTTQHITRLVAFAANKRYRPHDMRATRTRTRRRQWRAIATTRDSIASRRRKPNDAKRISQN